MNKRRRIMFGIAMVVLGIGFLAYYAAGLIVAEAFVGIATAARTHAEVETSVIARLSPYLGTALLLIGTAALFLPALRRRPERDR